MISGTPEVRLGTAEAWEKRTEGLFPGLLGVRVLERTKDRVTAELPVRDELTRSQGIAHGGVLISLADTLGGLATLLNLTDGAHTTTVESKTNFFAPAVAGMTVRAECVPLHRGRRTMVWQTRITGPEGRLLALVTQTQIVLPRERTPAETLSALFAGKTPEEQKALLAQLERGGAAVYRALAEQERDVAARQELIDAAAKEEENAETLEAQARRMQEGRG
jgi:uncharacterized protein (TIGR00369 family)